jgi:hypothetical protein
MSNLLNLKSREGYTFKVLAETLSKLILNGCLEIDHQDIKLTGVNKKHTILVDLILNKKNFLVYKIAQPVTLGINFGHLYKILQNLKKKEELSIELNTETSLSLNFKTVNNENSLKLDKNLKPHNIGGIPTDYSLSPIILTNKEFGRLKTLSKISTQIKVITYPEGMDFCCDHENENFTCKVNYGKSSSTITDTQEYETVNFINLVKLGLLANTIHIFTDPELPMMINMDVGRLGELTIFIKSKECIERELKESNPSYSNTRLLC